MTKKFKKISANNFTAKFTDGEGLNVTGSIKDKYSSDSPVPASSLKIEFSQSESGTKVEAVTDSMGKSSVKVENTKLADGLKVTAEGAQVPSYLVDVKKNVFCFVGATASFAQDMFNGKAGVKYYMQPADTDAKVDEYKAVGLGASVSAGQDGVSVGGTFSTALVDGKATNQKWSVGANVVKGKVNFGVVTKKFDGATAGVQYKSCPRSSVNVEVVSDFSKVNESKVTVGGQYQFNKDTLLQGKVNRDLTISTLVEYTSNDLNSKIQLASEWQRTGDNNFGISVSYGDN